MSEKPFYIPRVETHALKSRYVDETYRIQVMQPLMRKAAEERFPVLYITDANSSFDFASAISHSLQIVGQVRRFILVGIGYAGDNPFAGTILRIRDLTPQRRAEVADWPQSWPMDGVHDIAEGKPRWHGASDFLTFIRQQVIPFIDNAYPTVAGDRAYAGHSLGGGLGLHALFSNSDLFSRYLISSPSLSYDGDDHGIEPIQDFIASRAKLNARLFMTVGGEEEFESLTERSQFVSSVYRLAALLRKAKIPGLDFSYRVYPDETHASVWPISFTHGVQAVYGPADRPPLTQKTQQERERQFS